MHFQNTQNILHSFQRFHLKWIIAYQTICSDYHILLKILYILFTILHRLRIIVYLSKDSFSLDILLVPKIPKHHFFRDISNSCQWITQIGLKPNQNFFQIFFSTNMAAGGVQSFCILEGATDPLIE